MSIGTLRKKRWLTFPAAGLLSLAFIAAATPAGAAGNSMDDIINAYESKGDFDYWEKQLNNRNAALRTRGSNLSYKPGLSPRQRSSAVARSTNGNRLAGQPKTTQVAVTETKKPPAGKFAKGAKTAGRAGGSALLALFGFDMAYNGTSWALGNAFDVESNGFICDFQMATFGTSCDFVPGADYVINSDIGLGIPGWENGGAHATAIKNQDDDIGSASLEIIIEADYQRGDVSTEFYELWRLGFWNGSGKGIYSPSPGFSLHTMCVNGEKSGSSGLFPIINANFPDITGGDRERTWARSCSLVQGGLDYLLLEHGGVEVDRWYPESHPDYPDAVAVDPIRRWVVDYTCEYDGLPMFHQEIGEPWRESDLSWPEPPNVTCDDGGLLVAFEVRQEGEGVESVTLYDWQISPEERTRFAQIESDHHAAEQTGGLLELHYEDEVTGATLSCFDNPTLCTDWLNHPQREQTYSCTFATEIVPLEECLVYGPTFNPNTATQTGPAYGDPLTGEGPEPFPVGTATPPRDDSCPPPFTWLSMINPWYYYKSTVCALKDMFVPKRLDIGLARLSAAWTASSIGQLAIAVGNIQAAFVLPDDNNCGVIYEANPTQFQGHGITLNTCDPFWTQMAPVRNVLGAGFVVSGVFVGIRTASRILNVDPVAGGNDPE